MALAIFPPEELPGMQGTTRWIKDPNHRNGCGYDPLVLLWAFFPGPYPIKGIRLFLLKRKEASFLAPSFIFIFVFAHYAFQIIVPAPQHDRHLMEKKFTVYQYPFLVGNNLPFGDLVHGQKDLSSPNVVRGEKWDIIMHMENYEEMRHESDD